MLTDNIDFSFLELCQKNFFPFLKVFFFYIEFLLKVKI